jgi:hypothetical protein
MSSGRKRVLGKRKNGTRTLARKPAATLQGSCCGKRSRLGWMTTTGTDTTTALPVKQSTSRTSTLRGLRTCRWDSWYTTSHLDLQRCRRSTASRPSIHRTSCTSPRDTAAASLRPPCSSSLQDTLRTTGESSSPQTTGRCRWDTARRHWPTRSSSFPGDTEPRTHSHPPRSPCPQDRPCTYRH